ncbi:MAG: lytic transglycosylase domain-containing protein [Methylococcaceae bacterium]|nr:lytic transglycosylase domain-containing protein [Methylococcaceae bacterium]
MEVTRKMRIAIILLTLLVSESVLADIYKFVDSDGRVYYTDEPRHSLYKRIIQTKIQSSYPRYSKYNALNVHSYSGGNKKKYLDLINEVAYRHQVDAKLVHAVIQTESAYNSNAVSSAGAVGLMQLMPDTARRFGVTNRNDPDQNVEGGTRYLRHLIDMFNPNLDLAVAAYNAGENAVIKYNNSIPPYPETQNYVKQVLALYNKQKFQY